MVDEKKNCMDRYEYGGWTVLTTNYPSPRFHFVQHKGMCTSVCVFVCVFICVFICVCVCVVFVDGERKGIMWYIVCIVGR